MSEYEKKKTIRAGEGRASVSPRVWRRSVSMTGSPSLPSSCCMQCGNTTVPTGGWGAVTNDRWGEGAESSGRPLI